MRKAGSTRADNGDFIVGRLGITSHIFAIALLQNLFLTDSFSSEKMKGAVFKHGIVVFGFVKITIFVAAEDNDTGFGTVRVAATVRIDNEDTYHWDGFGGLACPFECEVTLSGDAFVDIVLDETLFLFIVAVHPDLTIKIDRMEGFG